MKEFISHYHKSFAVIGIILAVIVIAALGASSPTKMSAAENWYDYGWRYRKAITINYAKVANTDQSNFPVLISLTDADLQAHAKSDGYDILFADSTSTAKIPYERERYTASSGELVAWVKIATLSCSTNTVVYMYYGNSEATDQQDLTGATWDSNFKGVWHSGDASATTIADSTSNTNTGTKHGVAGPVEATGKIGRAQSYNGTDESISIDPSVTVAGSFTVSAWAKVLNDDDTRTIIGARNDIEDNRFDFKFQSGESIHGDIGDGTDWITNEADAELFYSYDNWYQITYVVTPTGYTIYLDGDSAASGNYDESAPLLFSPTHNIYIGQVGYDEEWFYGTIDEVRVSNVVRSADWIQTEYNNQSDPSTFYSLGSEVIGDETAPSVPGAPQAAVSADLSSQVWTWAASTDTGGSGMSHYHWQVDNGPSGTTTSETVTTSLEGGNWTFHVKAEDGASNQSAPHSALLSILSLSSYQVAIDNSIPVVWIVTPSNVTDPVIDLSAITVDEGELLAAEVNTEIHLKTLLPSATVTVDIPAGATIKGPSATWTRIIIPPISTTSSLDLLPAAPAGFSNRIALAIKLGHGVAPLSITKGSRIFMEGQADKMVGYIVNNIFTEITSACSDDSQAAGDALLSGQSCKIDSGSDLVIWTKHFSDFATYTLVQTAASGGGGCVNCYNPPVPPDGGFKVAINQGADTTSNRIVTLDFNAGADVRKMAISMTGDRIGSFWEDYQPTKQWDLCSSLGGSIKNPTCPDGTYKVYVKFFTGYDVSSPVVSSSIALTSSSLEPPATGGDNEVGANTPPQQNQPQKILTRYLRYGQSMADVKQLQIFLNKDPDTRISNSGVGSPGKETAFFGAKTLSAVKRFQEKYAKDVLTPWGLTKGTGFVGKTTLAKINDISDR